MWWNECVSHEYPEDKYSGLSREVSPWAISQLGLPGQARIGRVGKIALLIGFLAIVITVIAQAIG
jgi:hypothetical protein